MKRDRLRTKRPAPPLPVKLERPVSDKATQAARLRAELREAKDLESDLLWQDEANFAILGTRQHSLRELREARANGEHVVDAVLRAQATADNVKGYRDVALAAMSGEYEMMVVLKKELFDLDARRAVIVEKLQEHLERAEDYIGSSKGYDQQREQLEADAARWESGDVTELDRAADAEIKALANIYAKQQAHITNEARKLDSVRLKIHGLERRLSKLPPELQQEEVEDMLREGVAGDAGKTLVGMFDAITGPTLEEMYP